MRTAAVAASVAALAIGANAVAIDKNEISAMKRNIIKRQSLTTGASDAVVLNFALTLEHLEAAFYAQALAKYDDAAFASAGYTGARELVAQIGADESAHVAFLTSALTAAGVTPVQACNYTFPYTSVASFLGLSQVLEGVGTSAYLGAAGSINNTAYLTAAGSILTVEARHAAFIQFLNGYQPAPQPNDTPQSAAAVVTMATPFFASCPTGSAPAIAGKPALTVTTTAPAVGSMLSIAPTNASAVATTGTVYCGFASGLGAAFSAWTNGSCMIPTANITNGQTYVALTTGPSVSDASVIAGPAIILLGTANNTVTLASSSNSTGSSGSGSSGSSSSSAPAAGSSGATTAPASGAATFTYSAVAMGSVVLGGLALLF